MPENPTPQKTIDPRGYCVLVITMIPFANEEEAENYVPEKKAGTPIFAEVVERNDFNHEEDWATIFDTIGRGFGRQVRRRGWPEWIVDDGMEDSETADPGPGPEGQGTDQA